MFHAGTKRLRRLAAVAVLAAGCAAADGPWLVEAGPDGSLRVTLAPGVLREVREQDAIVLRWESGDPSFQGGTPDVGLFTILLPGRPSWRATYRLERALFEERTNVVVAPVPVTRRLWLNDAESSTETRREADPTVYEADGFWPPVLAELTEGWQGTNKLLRLAITPAQYHPTRHLLRVYSLLEGVVEFVPE